MRKPKGYFSRPFSNEPNLCEVTCFVIHETEYAILADVGKSEPVWLQKSKLEDWPDKGCHGELIMHIDYSMDKDIIDYAVEKEKR